MPTYCRAIKKGGATCDKRPCAQVALHGLARVSCREHIEPNWSDSFQDTNDRNVKRIPNRFYQSNASDLSNHQRELQWIIDFMEKKKVSNVDDDIIPAVLLELLTTEDIEVDLRDLRKKVLL